MNVLGWLDDRSDWLSPLIVKEVRQTVRSREFTLSFTACLVAGLAIAFFGAADAVTGRGTAGAWTFAALMGCLAFLGLAVVPLGAYAAIRQERSEQTLELITLTALTPRRLVIGKLLAQVVKLATLFAAIAPFVTMTFLLGGVDLLTIMLSLVALFLWSVWLCAACLFVSTLFKSRILSAIVFGAVAVFAFFIIVGSRGAMLAIGRGSVVFGVAGASAADFYLALAIGLTFWVTTLVILMLLAENRLSLPTEDRVTPLRVAVFVQFAAIVGWTLAFFGDPADRDEAAAALAVAGSVHLLIVALFAVTDDLTMPRRVWQRLQEPSRWHLLMAIFRPGAGRAALYMLVQMALFVAAGALFQEDGLDVGWFLASCGYVCFFTGIPVVAVRFVAPVWGTVVKLRLAVLLTLASAVLLPDLLHYVIVQPEVLRLDYSARHLINPFRTLAEWPRLPIVWRFVPFALGIVGVFAYVAIIQMGRRAMSPAAPARWPPAAATRAPAQSSESA